jgi:hypothetical protein
MKTTVKARLTKTTSLFFLQLAVIGLLIFTSCSGDDTTASQSPQVAEIAISPDSAELEAGEQLQFEVFALSATGETIDASELDIEWEWWSTDPEVFTVEAGGLATGQNPGEAYCMIEATVGVSRDFNEMPDKLIVRAGYGQDDKVRFQTVNLELSAENNEISAFENVALKNRLRFVGRDSAFVMIF